jgi:hypothetical protein
MEGASLSIFACLVAVSPCPFEQQSVDAVPPLTYVSMKVCIIDLEHLEKGGSFDHEGTTYKIKNGQEAICRPSIIAWEK